MRLRRYLNSRAAFVLAWLCGAPFAHSHYCGQEAYQISPDVYAYYIVADVLESQPTIYEVIDRGTPAS
ncbi:MAG: hypothetical protein EXS36_12295 [Pedosphaera sp.]|nr:hypothetical protein [Pedosphaera sp.]